MSLTKITENLNNVSSLPDKPSLQAEELKQEFDKAGNSIKEYINAILTEEIDKIITNLTNRISTNESNISDNTENIENANANITKKAPTSHASSATTYGVGTTSNYGHCKLANSLTTSSHTDGVALSAYQGKVLNDSVNGKAPTSHASSATTYGVGTTANYGHCKLVNNLTTPSFANGVALSGYQGKVLNDSINTLKTIVSSLSSNVTSINNKFDNGFTTGGGVTANRDFYTGTGNINSETGNIYTGTGDIYTTTGEIRTGTGDISSGRDVRADGSFKSDSMYDSDNVTNAPNTYVTSNGWLRRTTGSSKRYKTDITEDVEERLNPEVLYNLPIKQFKYKDDCISKDDVRYGKNILGFIAEDVAEIYESAVQYDEKGQVEMWNAQVMIPAMLKLIQEQNERIKVLEEKVLS